MNTTYDVPKASVFTDVVEHFASHGHMPDKPIVPASEVADGSRTDDKSKAATTFSTGNLSYRVLWDDIMKVLRMVNWQAL